MSRSGTMNSSISNQAFQQQQQNLHQLQTLENNYNHYQQSKSFTSSDSRTRAIAEVVSNAQDDGSSLQLAQPQTIQQSAQQLQHSNSFNSSIAVPNQHKQTASINQPQPFQQQQQQQQLLQQQQLQQQQQQQQQQQHAQSQPSLQLNRPVENQSRITSSATASKNISSSDPRNPFAVQVPTNSNPTEVLAARFAAWRNTITALLQYLTEVSSIQDEVVRQQIRLTHAVNFPAFRTDQQAKSGTAVGSHKQDAGVLPTSFFLPQGNGSIQDLPGILMNFHSSYANLASKASKELNLNVIPRLDDLRRELLVKIKEIKGLSSDFKNNVSKELSQTKLDLQAFNRSIEDAKFNTHNVQPKNDPYLTKIILDKQIKRQLIEENYLHEAFINLQSSGKELEKVVVIEIQNALTVYAKLFGEQAQNIFDNLITNLDYGFLTKTPSFEWDNFVAKDSNFIDENLPKRDYKQIQYDKMSDPLTLEIRSSYLERRSKFLKSYSKAYYVLTPSFFHEFKSSDRKKDVVPVMSLPIDDIELEEHSKKDTNHYKFVVKKVGKLSSHKFIFRADTYESMLAWYNTIKELKKLPSPSARGVYASKHRSTQSVDISRVSSGTSKVQRPSSINDSTHETDTILSVPNQNQTLPQESSTPIPQSMISSDGVVVARVGSNSNILQQAKNQRQSLPPQSVPSQYRQQGPQLQSRHSMQYIPYQAQGQSSTNSYPSQEPNDTQNFVVPEVQFEAATPVSNSYPNSPQATNPLKFKPADVQSSKFENFNGNGNKAIEPDASGISEESKSARKETHNDDAEDQDSLSSYQDLKRGLSQFQQKQQPSMKSDEVSFNDRFKPVQNQFRTLDLKQAAYTADQPYANGH